MEIGPIFRALLHHRTRFFLITIEIALTLAIVVNCLNILRDQRAKIERPTGMAVDDVVVATVHPFDPVFQDDDFVETIYHQDVDALRALPGVRGASAAHAIPLSGGGSATGVKLDAEDPLAKRVAYFVVGEDAIDTFGVALVEGRGFGPEDFHRDEEAEERMREEGTPIPRNIIVTRATAKHLFGDEQALGRTVTNRSGTSISTVVGVLDRMHGSWPLSDVAERVMLYPGRPGGGRSTNYMVRAEEGAIDEVYATVEEALLAVHEGRNVRVRTLAEIKAGYYEDLSAVNQLLGGISLLLVAVTSLGVIGLTSFSVTERFRQIGTRRALGATRGAVVRYFLVENAIVAFCGLSVGIVLAVGLNDLLGRFADAPPVEWQLVATATVALWAVGLVATLAPALRGAAIPPVIATRTV